MIIGLTGRIASGKGEIAEYLKKKGFEYYTMSQMVREVTAKIGLPIKREVLQDVGDLIRKYEGAGGWAKRIINVINPFKNYVIDGIRNPGEIEEFKNAGKFLLISVDAPQEERFKRVLYRNKASDPKTFNEFVKVDERDFGMKEAEIGQQVGKCMALADFSIINNSSMEEFHKKIDKFYKTLKGGN